MPQIDVSEFQPTDALAVIVMHLVEQLTILNRTMSNIDESLQAISSRLSYATALDNQD